MGQGRELTRAAGIWGWTVRGLELALALGCVAGSFWLKLTVDAGGPLWLDEAWTGAVVSAHGWAAFWRQAWLDVNPPLYFLLMHLWTGVFGLSGLSLRAPSLIAGLLTPVAVAAVRTPGLSGAERLTWAGVLGLWTPAILFAQEARGYSLLILLVTLQTIAFVRLVRRPELSPACLWAAASTLCLLTHYQVVFLLAAQGVALLAMHRLRLFRLWPAAFVFLPALAWMAVHAPRVAAFMRPGVAWYPKPDAWVIEQALDAFADGWPVLAGIAAVLVGGTVVERALGRRTSRFAPGEGALWLAAAASLVAAAGVLGMGWLRPSFTPRYMVPFGPAAILGLVLACRNLSESASRLVRIALMIMAVASAAHLALTQHVQERRAYQFQTASEALMRAGVTRLAFFWDNPTDRALAPEERGALAGFFFTRAHRPVTVVGVTPPAGTDPNPALAAAARAPGSGLMWVYDLRVPDTAARRFAPRLQAIDPGLRCGRYVGPEEGTGYALGVIACVRAPASLPSPAPPM